MRINEKRLTILKLLHKNKNEFVSGAEIAEKLEASRTTVSNYIEELRAKGYIIEARTNKGYILKFVPDNLLPEEIYCGLKTDFMGREIEFFPEIDSTNKKAKEIAGSDAGEGMLVIADRQTEGRGRRGKNWFSPERTGLWFSLILKPHFRPRISPVLTFIASLAVKKVLLKKGFTVFLKWPNDLYINKKKAAGILVEIDSEIGHINRAVVGFGINVNHDKFPSELKNRAISLKQVTGETYSRSKLLQELLFVFEDYYKKLKQGQESQLLGEWKSQLDLIGKKVNIKQENNSFYGQVVDVSDRGALVIKDTAGHKRKLWAGDISLDVEDFQ